jgi:transposase
MLKLSDSVISNIRTNIKSGIVIRKIAHKYGVSLSIVPRILREHEPEASRNKARRPSRISLNTRRLMVRNIITRNLDNAIQVQKYLEEELEITISANRVRQILKQEDLTTQHKKKRPKLTRAHIQKRLEFVRRYEHWTVEDWKKVLWTDETKINRYGSDGTQWVWKSNKIGMQARLIEETLKHGGGSLMMWGCMT